MMGFSPLDGKQLTYWEYTALLTEWNERHQSDDDKPDAPDPDFFERQMERLRNSPGMLN